MYLSSGGRCIDSCDVNSSPAMGHTSSETCLTMHGTMINASFPEACHYIVPLFIPPITATLCASLESTVVHIQQPSLLVVANSRSTGQGTFGDNFVVRHPTNLSQCA
jgi:hypothetical protein